MEPVLKFWKKENTGVITPVDSWGGIQEKNGTYRVGIGFKGKRYNLGTYKTFAEAVDVRLQAEQAIHGGL